MKTVVVNHEDIKREWHIVDATDVVLGRLASTVAGVLMGKKKPAYAPNQDHGDNVVIVNSDKIVVTGNKANDKFYFRHSRQPGGGKQRSFKRQMEMDSTRVILNAVHGMIPKTALGRAILRKLYVYPGATHPHAAQKPAALNVK
jgi:large subunit ribosomal protein L13